MSRALPELFGELPGPVEVADPQAAIPWPAGSVEWTCGQPPPSCADAAWRVDGRSVYAWGSTRWRVELALWQVKPVLPGSMRVSKVWMGHWRVRSAATGPLPILRASLQATRGPLDGGPDSGQGLDAQTWDGEGYRISIGTEDAEALALRAGRSLPAAWKQALTDAHLGDPRPSIEYPVQYESNAVNIVLPAAPPGVFDFHHAVAWQQLDSDEDAWTWYAVELARDSLPRRLRS